MKESDRKGIANHPGPESCAGRREAAREALTGVARAWLTALRRRSRRHRLPWARFRVILDHYLPTPRILHPEPGARFDAKYSR